jgi:hypothetical protein
MFEDGPQPRLERPNHRMVNCRSSPSVTRTFARMTHQSGQSRESGENSLYIVHPNRILRAKAARCGSRISDIRHFRFLAQRTHAPRFGNNRHKLPAFAQPRTGKPARTAYTRRTEHGFASLPARLAHAFLHVLTPHRHSPDRALAAGPDPG